MTLGESAWSDNRLWLQEYECSGTCEQEFFPVAALIHTELVVKHTECMYIGAKLGRGGVFKLRVRHNPTHCVGSSSLSFQSDAAAHPDRLTSDQDEKDSAFPPNPSLF